MKTFKEDDLKEALRAIASMIHKIDKVKGHFEQGTPQHTLAKNRLKALRIATALIKEERKNRFSN